MKVGYYTLGGDISQSYGLALCLHVSRVMAEPCTISTAKYYDAVLVSCFWWKHIEEFYSFCKVAKIGKVYGKTKTRLIIGGFNSFNPTLFDRHAHVVVVGDGEDVLLDAINGVDRDCFWYAGKKKCAYNNADISTQTFLYTNERNISRVEIARGCPYRCKFCQLSAIKKYREVNTETVISAIAFCKSKTISCFAPNRTSHSGFKTIFNKLDEMGISDKAPDVRFNHIDKIRKNQSVQIGIEGLSERLRFLNGKKLSDVELVQIIEKIINRGVHKKPHLFAGIILGLPTQSEIDFLAFDSILNTINKIVGISCFTFFPVFNMFMPMPHTAWENEPLFDLTYDYSTAIKKVLYDRKFAICVKGRLHSNYSRLKSMVATRLDSSAEDVFIALKPVEKIQGEARLYTAIKILQKLGVEDVIGVPKNKPWKCVCL